METITLCDNENLILVLYSKWIHELSLVMKCKLP